MKIRFKTLHHNHLLNDLTIDNDSSDTRTHKIFNSLEEACHTLNLAVPIWLDSTVRDFQKHSRARFYADNFTESIDFDYLEIEVLEE